MMKKLFVLFVLLLVAGFSFAQDAVAADAEDSGQEFFDLEISVGVPIHWTNSALDHGFYNNGAGDDEDKTVTADTAIGLALLWNFSPKFGLTVDMDFFVGSDVMGHSQTQSYSTTLFGANALLGPVIYLYNGSFLRIPLALGVHVYYWSSDNWRPGQTNNWIKTRDFQAGPGAYIGVQFHFNDNIYIFSRTNVAVDIVRWHAVDVPGNTDSELDFFDVGWLVKPALGIGIKF